MEVTGEVTTEVRCCQVNTCGFVGWGAGISADLKNRNCHGGTVKSGIRHRGTEKEELTD
jgi:hypothetical protein